LSQASLEVRRGRARLAFCLLLLFLPVQLLAMHWPVPKLPPSVAHVWDKVPHFVLYALFASLLVWYIVAQRRALGQSNARGLPRRLATAFVCVAAYAWIDELTQPWTGRECDVYDWLADVLGAATVIIGAYAWRRYRMSNPLPARAQDWAASPLSLDAVD
jgi:VanZ family protein